MNLSFFGLLQWFLPKHHLNEWGGQVERAGRFTWQWNSIMFYTWGDHVQALHHPVENPSVFNARCLFSQTIPTARFTARGTTRWPSTYKSRCILRWNSWGPQTQKYRWSWRTAGRRSTPTGRPNPGGTSSLTGNYFTLVCWDMKHERWWKGLLSYMEAFQTAHLFSLRCANPVDSYQVIFHPVWMDSRVQYPSHFKRFEVKMFAFAEDKDNLNKQVNPRTRTWYFSAFEKKWFISITILQVFVHCDVVICDAKNPAAGPCQRLCSRQGNKIKGMASISPDEGARFF